LRLAETLDKPLAIVSGEREPFINNDYLQSIRYANLWDKKVHVLPGLGHAVFWEAPQTFDPIFSRFLADVL
jgi:pimeloyl-ACP methyl ester carboxylesterase